MSKYATWLLFDEDDVEDEGTGAPYVYQGSHILPTANDKRGGWLEIGGIPAFCGEDGELVDFLRVGTGSGELELDRPVLLDRRQVTVLRDRLTMWLEREPEIG